MLKKAKIRDKKHREFIASLPCVVSGVSGMTQAAHIRHNNGGGMGLKPGDDYCIPLSWWEHAEQHEIGELNYWPDIEDAKELALDLYRNTGDRDKCLEMIARYRDLYSNT